MTIPRRHLQHCHCHFKCIPTTTYSMHWSLLGIIVTELCTRSLLGGCYTVEAFTIPSLVVPKRTTLNKPIPKKESTPVISGLIVHRISRQRLQFSEAEDDASADNSTMTTTTTSAVVEDWRDVRARLIEQFQKQYGNQQQQQPEDEDQVNDIVHEPKATTTNGDSGDTGSTKTTAAWAYDSGGVIERGSLLISHPVQDFACGGLRQQYLTKCVVLIIKDEPTFTKGVILNRNVLTYKVPFLEQYGNGKINTNNNRTHSHHDSHHHPTKNHVYDWTIYYGGDVQGIDSPETDFTCLHRLQSPTAKKLSSPLVKDIQHTTLDVVKLLVEQGEATPEDFILFAGYVGWGRDRLQEELERGNWFMVATDSQSISQLLVKTKGTTHLSPTGRQSRNNATTLTTTGTTTNTTTVNQNGDLAGVETWKYWMRRIGKGDLVDQYTNTQDFEDAMLNKWIEEKHVSVPYDPRRRDPQKNGFIIQPIPEDEKELPRLIQVGTIYRAIRPIVLEEQVFHRSLVLIVNTDERGYVGVILNRPSSRVTTLNTRIKGGRPKDVTLRYGGRYGLEQEGTPETWLHYGNTILQNARVGTPLVGTGGGTATTSTISSDHESPIWQCSRQDAEIAIEMGLASPRDFLVTWGFTLWEKNRPPRGLGRPLTSTSLDDEFKAVHKSAIPNLWKELLKQTTLTDATLEQNLEYADAAHEIAQSPLQVSIQKRGGKAVDLADDALRRWIRMFIMKSNAS